MSNTGVRLNTLRTGINIVRGSDGRFHKVLMKQLEKNANKGARAPLFIEEFLQIFIVRQIILLLPLGSVGVGSFFNPPVNNHVNSKGRTSINQRLRHVPKNGIRNFTHRFHAKSCD